MILSCLLQIAKFSISSCFFTKSFETDEDLPEWGLNVKLKYLQHHQNQTWFARTKTNNFELACCSLPEFQFNIIFPIYSHIERKTSSEPNMVVRNKFFSLTYCSFPIFSFHHNFTHSFWKWNKLKITSLIQNWNGASSNTCLINFRKKCTKLSWNWKLEDCNMPTLNIFFLQTRFLMRFFLQFYIQFQ